MTTYLLDPNNLPMLQQDDILKIPWRPAPWHFKFHIPYSGIQIIGILGPNGEKPVISGENAVELPTPGYFDSSLQNRGLMMVCPRAGAPYDESIINPSVVNLELRDANINSPGFTQFGTGTTVPWYNTSAFSAYRCQGLALENCRLTNCDQGLFAKSYDEESRTVKNPVFDHLVIELNGSGPGQHNAYTETLNPVFRFCTFGDLLPASDGFGSHDRNCGADYESCVFTGGAHLLDMVGAEDSAYLRSLEGTPQAINHLRGGVLVKPHGLWTATGIHFGTDGGTLPRQLLMIEYCTILNLDEYPGEKYGTQFMKLNGTRVQLVNNAFHVLSPDPNVGRGEIQLGSAEYPEYGVGLIESFTNGYPSDMTYPTPPDTAQYGDVVLYDDPGWVDPLNGDFSLTADSPLRGKAIGIDTGPGTWRGVLWQPVFGPNGITGSVRAGKLVLSGAPTWKPRTSWNQLGAWEG